MHIEFVESPNDLANKQNVPINAPINVPINNTEKTVLEIIRNRPNLTYDEIALMIKRDKKTVQRAINRLKKLGLLERIGSNKTGHWEVIEK